MPSISIIIPAYNADRTILATIESVLNQTYSDFEIIVINDGSNDRTLELLNSIQDERLQVFSSQNSGVCIARNYGISLATGEFISFMDADDLWTPDKLEAQVEVLKQHPEADVAYSWTYFYYDQTGKRFRGNPTFFTGNVYAELLKRNFLDNGSNILVRRQAIKQIGGFDPVLTHGTDWDFYLRLAAQYKFVVVPQHQIVYRQSPTSTTIASKIEIMEASLLTVIEKAYRSAPIEYQYLKKQSLACIYEYLAQQCLKSNNNFAGLKIASRKFCKAIKIRPQILLEDYGQNLAQWLLKRWIIILINSIFKPN